MGLRALESPYKQGPRDIAKEKETDLSGLLDSLPNDINLDVIPDAKPIQPGQTAPNIERPQTREELGLPPFRQLETTYELGGKTVDQKEELLKKLGTAPGDDPGFLSDFVDSIKSSYEKDPTSFAGKLEKQYGQGNVVLTKEGEIFLRKPGQQFKKFVPDHLDDAKDVILAMGRHAPDIVYGAVAGPISGGKSILAKAGREALALAGGLAAKRGTGELLGADQQPVLGDVVDYGVAQGLATGATGLAHTLYDVASQTPTKRLYRMLEVQNAINQVVKGMGPSVSSEMAHMPVTKALPALRTASGKHVGLLQEKAIEEASKNGTQMFPTDNLVTELRGLLQKEGVQIVNGKAETIEQLTERGFFKENVSPFGVSGGKTIVEDLVDKHNLLVDNKTGAQGSLGAMNLRGLINMRKGLSDPNLAGFDKSNTTKVNSIYRDLYDKTSMDEQSAIGKALSNTPQAKEVDNAYGNYRVMSDALKAIKNAIKEDQEDVFYNSMIKSDRPDLLINLKTLLGRGKIEDGALSEEFRSVRDAYLNSLIFKHKNLDTRIFDASGMVSDIKRLGQPVIDELFPKGDFNRFVQLSRKFSEVNLSDLGGPVKLNDAKNLVNGLESIVSGGPAKWFGRMLFSYGNSVRLTEALEDQMITKIQKTESSAYKKWLIDSALELRTRMSESDIMPVVLGKKLVDVYVPKSGTFVPLIKPTEEKYLKSTKGYGK